MDIKAPELGREWKDAWDLISRVPSSAFHENRFMVIFFETMKHCVAAQIVNDHYYEKETKEDDSSSKKKKVSQYESLMVNQEVSRMKYDAFIKEGNTLNSVPDLIDFKNECVIYISFVSDISDFSNEELEEVCIQSSGPRNDHYCILFDFIGNSYEQAKMKSSPARLQTGQTARAKKVIVMAKEYLDSVGRFQEFLDTKLMYGQYRLMPMSDEYMKLLSENTDIPFMKLEEYEKGDDIYKADVSTATDDISSSIIREMKKMDEPYEYVKMEGLPLLDITPKTEVEASWGFQFILGDAKYLKMDEMGDVTLCSTFSLSNYEFVIEKEGTFKIDSMFSLEKSISLKGENVHSRKPIPSDKMLFGIGIKKKKKDHFSDATDDIEWEKFKFELERKSFPKWVDKEMSELSSLSEYQKVVELDTMPEYCEIDKVSNSISEYFLETVAITKGTLSVEKIVETCAKIMRSLNEDRDDICLYPITTRKGNNETQLWGFVMVGPHHIKRESDKIPLVVVEFYDGISNEEFDIKYPKNSRGYLNINGLKVLCSFKVTSISKYRLSIFCQLRRVMLQVFNVYSRAMLRLIESAGKVTMNSLLTSSSLTEIEFYGTEATMRMYDWAKEVLSLHILMAVHDNSELEGGLASLRKLQMAKHAMVENKEVFTLKSASVSDNLKCDIEECVITNPMMIYIAKSHNDSVINGL